MTPEQTHLVRQTSVAALSSGRFADRFYDALFASAPETRRLFPSDLASLKLKFVNMLASIVGAIEHPNMFGSILLSLGSQHRYSGVEPAHYAPARAALLTALDAALGARFTPEVREAWATLYDEIARHMQAGAQNA